MDSSCSESLRPLLQLHFLSRTPELTGSRAGLVLLPEMRNPAASAARDRQLGMGGRMEVHSPILEVKNVLEAQEEG